jgi:hypothetical protein
MIKLEELKEILDQTGIPVAYSHFVESENQPIPDPPFITYLVTDSANFFADNQVYIKIQNVQIELYTDLKDLEAEANIERILNENEIPFGTSEVFIESEDLFQKIYEVRVL